MFSRGCVLTFVVAVFVLFAVMDVGCSKVSREDSEFKRRKEIEVEVADAEALREILESLGTPCVIHQARYSMLDRWVEKGLLDTLDDRGIGCIAFSPLAQGLLTNKYLKEIPENSRAASPYGFLQRSAITPALVDTLKKLNALASRRGQSLAQMALSWVLKDPRITSVLIGARNKEQLLNSFKCTENTDFTLEELNIIDDLLTKY